MSKSLVVTTSYLLKDPQRDPDTCLFSNSFGICCSSINCSMNYHFFNLTETNVYCKHTDRKTYSPIRLFWYGQWLSKIDFCHYVQVYLIIKVKLSKKENTYLLRVKKIYIFWDFWGCFFDNLDYLIKYNVLCSSFMFLVNRKMCDPLLLDFSFNTFININVIVGFLIFMNPYLIGSSIYWTYEFWGFITTLFSLFWIYYHSIYYQYKIFWNTPF